MLSPEPEPITTITHNNKIVYQEVVKKGYIVRCLHCRTIDFTLAPAKAVTLRATHCDCSRWHNKVISPLTYLQGEVRDRGGASNFPYLENCVKIDMKLLESSTGVAHDKIFVWEPVIHKLWAQLKCSIFLLDKTMIRRYGDDFLRKARGRRGFLLPKDDVKGERKPVRRTPPVKRKQSKSKNGKGGVVATKPR